MEGIIKIKKNNKLFLIQLIKKYFNINFKISILYIIGSVFYYWSLAKINQKNGINCLKKKILNVSMP